MKKLFVVLVSALLICAVSMSVVSAAEPSKTTIPYKLVTCSNAEGKTFKEIVFAEKEWIVLNEDTESNTSLILMKDNYKAGLFGQVSDNNAKVTYKDSKIDKTMCEFYDNLSNQDKSLISQTSFKESIVINKRDYSGKPSIYLEAGDPEIDKDVALYGLQGAIINSTQNTYTMDRYVFAPSAKDTMDFGLECLASTENGGLLKYTSGRFDEDPSSNVNYADCSNLSFYTRSADTTRTGFIYSASCEGAWDTNHGLSYYLGIRPALNLDMSKVSFVDEGVPVGMSISDGNPWIVITIAALAIGITATLFIVKRKKVS